MEMSFEQQDIDWDDYGIAGGMSSALVADAAKQAAWENALIDELGAVGVAEADARNLIPEDVIYGWDIAIGSSHEELWMEFLDNHPKADEIVIFTKIDSMATANEELLDNDETLRLEEFVNDAYGYRPSWNSVFAETLLKETAHLPKGWFKMGYANGAGGNPQSINYAILKV